MQRITTGTADTDLFGEGKPGFVDGNAGIALPPTRLNAAFFNAIQEEVARCVEGDGATVVPTGGTADYHQLGDAVGHGSDAMFPRTTASRFVVEGLTITGISGLDVALQGGRFVFEGRRYVITGAKLVAAFPAQPHQHVITFGGTATNGDYETTFEGYGLSSDVTVTTTRAAGTPADNSALAAQHATDILAEGDLAGVVLDAFDVGPLVFVIIDGGLATGELSHAAPAPGTLESEPFATIFTVADNVDTYFFLAPEDPSNPSDPPDRATIWVETDDVATGAAAPATPTGTLLFAMVASSAGTAGAATYRNRGPTILQQSGRGFRLKPLSSGTVAALVPAGLTSSPDVDIGEAVPDGEAAPHNGGYIRNLYVEHVHLRSAAASDQDAVYTDEFTFQQNVGAGATVNVVLLDTSGFPDGSSFYVSARGVAIDPSDPTDGYSFRTETHAHIDSTLTLDGSGGGNPPPFEGGAGGAAAGMDVNFSVSGSDLRLTLTGHSGDATRWFVKVEIVASGDTP